MEAKVVVLESVAAKRNEAGFDVRRMVEERVGSVNIACRHAIIPPGASNGPHVQEKMIEVLYYLSGQAVVEIEGGEKYTMGPDTVIMIPPGIRHTHKNPGTQPMVQFFVGVTPE